VARPSAGYAPPPPGAYAPPPPPNYPGAPRAQYGRSTYANADASPQSGRLVWTASPRGTPVKPDPEAKFKAAKAKAAKVGVENLTKNDIAGLSAAQIKELRGY